jgi:transcriptional regulator with XRE-family HTH domain
MSSRQQLILDKFAENVQRLRVTKNLTQRELASRCQLSHSKIGLIESGKVNVTLLTLFELGEGLEIPPSKLLEFKY